MSNFLSDYSHYSRGGVWSLLCLRGMIVQDCGKGRRSGYVWFAALWSVKPETSQLCRDPLSVCRVTPYFWKIRSAFAAVCAFSVRTFTLFTTDLKPSQLSKHKDSAAVSVPQEWVFTPRVGRWWTPMWWTDFSGSAHMQQLFIMPQINKIRLGFSMSLRLSPEETLKMSKKWIMPVFIYGAFVFLDYRLYFKRR